MQNDDRSYYCALCDKAFSVPSGTEPRCPVCLRTTGVSARLEGVESALSEAQQAHSPRSRGNRFRWVFVSIACLALAIAGAAFWLAFRVGPGQESTLQTVLVEAGIPNLLGQEKSLSLKAEFPSGIDQVGDWLQGLGLTAGIPETPPTDIRSPEELREAPGQACPLELLLFSVAAGKAGSRGGMQACEGPVGSIAMPFWSRSFGLCVAAPTGGLDVLDFVQGPLGIREDWKLANESRCVGLFLAALGEASAVPKEAYQWFDLALRTEDRPEYRFHLGLKKVAFGVADFGIDDLRTALTRESDAGGFEALGVALLSQRKAADEALNAFSTALEKEPGRVESRKGKAQALLWLNQIEPAVAELQSLLEESPGTPGVHAALAQAYMLRKDSEKAIAELEEELKIAPSVPLVLGLADLEKQLHGSEAALKRLEAHRKLPGGGALAAQTLSILVREGRMDEALGRISEWDKDYQEDATFLRAAGMVQREAGQVVVAEQTLAKALALVPESDDLLVQVALCRLLAAEARVSVQGRWEEDIRALMGRNPEAVIQLAQQMGLQGKAALAEKVLRLAMEATDKPGRIATALYALLAGSGKIEEAGLLRKDMQSKLTGSDLSLFEQMTGSVDSALESARKAGQKAPETPGNQ